MRRNCCHTFLAFLLKVLNYLQTFVGVSIILYSIWMLNQWKQHVPTSPSPTPSSFAPEPSLSLSLGSRSSRFFDRANHLEFTAGGVSAFDDGLGLQFNLNSFELPSPWFIYSFMGVGALVCCITVIGCIAAEALNGCCLCFYTLLIMLLILLEALLVGFIAVDHQWMKDLPFDPTGELESLCSFFEDNADICKWIGIAVVVIQALSLLLAIILRALVSSQRADFDSEDGYDTAQGRIREPLLNQHVSQPSRSAKVDDRVTHSDFWSSQIRDKYGLNSGDRNIH